MVDGVIEQVRPGVSALLARIAFSDFEARYGIETRKTRAMVSWRPLPQALEDETQKRSDAGESPGYGSLQSA